MSMGRAAIAGVAATTIPMVGAAAYGIYRIETSTPDPNGPPPTPTGTAVAALGVGAVFVGGLIAMTAAGNGATLLDKVAQSPGTGSAMRAAASFGNGALTPIAIAGGLATLGSIGWGGIGIIAAGIESDKFHDDPMTYGPYREWAEAGGDPER